MDVHFISIVFVDRDTFKEILTFINDNHLNRIKAIIWNIDPTIREDEVISRQAYLINMFKPKDIWNNVIIICKKVTLIKLILMIETCYIQMYH